MKARNYMTKIFDSYNDGVKAYLLFLKEKRKYLEISKGPNAKKLKYVLIQNNYQIVHKKCIYFDTWNILFNIVV